MTKIVALVNRCKECPNRQYYSGGVYECIKVWRKLKEGEAIPRWCPLPEYPSDD
jgi:hypothetical protein